MSERHAPARDAAPRRVVPRSAVQCHATLLVPRRARFTLRAAPRVPLRATRAAPRAPFRARRAARVALGALRRACRERRLSRAVPRVRRLVRFVCQS